MTSKISPATIVAAHAKTMRDDARHRVSTLDWIVFFGLPALAGFIAYYSGEKLTNEVFNGSASVFGIFVGLLLNVQVAIFGIFLRKPVQISDSTAKIVLEKQLVRRARVLRELNANIAYLILICTFGIALCMIFLSLSSNSSVFTGLVLSLYIHVILNLLMAVKRAFILFDAEYQCP